MRFEPLSFPLFLLLLIVIFLIIYIGIIQPRLSNRRLLNKNEHGSSKFADEKEIKSNYVKESLNNINNAGFPVWYEKKGNIFKNVYFDTKSPHYLLVGSTGAGKSATVSINMAIHFATAKEKNSVILTDPKGELFRSTGKIFENNGYKIVTIDFRNPSKSNKINVMQPIIDEWKEHCHSFELMMFFLSHFVKSNKVNLDKIVTNEKYLNQVRDKLHLDDSLLEIIKENIETIQEQLKDRKFYIKEIIKDVPKDLLKEYINNKSNDELLLEIKKYQNLSSKHHAETNRLVISLSNLIFVEKETKDPYWINASKQLFVGIVGIFLEDYKLGYIDENKINISSIKKFQTSSLLEINKRFLEGNLKNRNYGSLSKDYLTSIFSSAENTFKSIISIFSEKMAIFDDLNVENITSISEFQFSEVGTKPVVLYIIVPDEDKAYFQLVTIIIGMLIKDLTKLANLPGNNGTLPVRTEWIFDEFANCPPLDSIETTVSVARSRGMRFFFFIQSFSQLNQVYGKEIANIIQDNAALVYLKTNTVETAEVIAKKLGKATIETNSISMSTDPFKIGANQTKSLIGKELLTANEIINLKYKTIIFPTFGNPIFRDTYLYSDIYPNYKNIDVCDREEKILKRNTKNYYTVELLRKNYTKEVDTPVKKVAKKDTSSSSSLTLQNSINQRKHHQTGVNNIEKILTSLKLMFKNKLISEEKNRNETYEIKVNGILNKFDLSKIANLNNDEVLVAIGTNRNTKETILTLWEC